MRFKTKVEIIVAIFIAIIALIPNAVRAETYENLTYEIENEEVTITGIVDKNIKKVEIPKIIDNCPVIKIKNYAFMNCSLENVKIAEGIVTIGERAFAGCSDLASLEIPNSVINIEKLAFSHCEKLENVRISKNVKVINSAFNQSGLIEVDLEDGITEIPEHAFEECKSLTDIDIPDSVTSIGEFAFAGCISLQNIDIPDSVTNIADNTFYRCTNEIVYVYKDSYAEEWANNMSINVKTYPRSLSECTINKLNNRQYTGNEIKPSLIVKDGTKKLKENIDYSVTYSDNLNIGTATVIITGIKKYKDTNQTQFNITQESVEREKIKGQNGNFIYEADVETDEATITKYNANMSSVKIPRTIDGYTVTAIGSQAFFSLDSLASVQIPNTVKSIGFAAFKYCSNLSSINIPDSIETIGTSAFSTCNFKSITLGSNVKEINGYTFENCGHLENIEIPDSVTEIGWATFSGCSNLKSIKIGKNTKNISKEAFKDCTNLTDIFIPANVKNIANGAFLNCTGLTNINVDENNTVYDSRENCNAIIKTKSNELVCGCINTIIPNDIKIIGDYAFYNCTELKQLKVPEGVNKIGDYTFYGCMGLTKIVLPDIVEYIGHYAFYDCRYLSSINMPKNLTQIGVAAFYNGISLQSIDIPDKVKNIGHSAFYNCSKLKNIVLPDSVEQLGAYAFYACTSIESVRLSENLSSIEAYTFCSCKSLIAIEIPSKINKIGNNAFRVCSNLIKIYIIDDIDEFGENVFAYKNENLVIYLTKEFTNAQQYAISNGIKTKIASISILPYYIEEIPNQEYTGEEIKPNIVLKKEDGVILNQASYDVYYEDNIKVGKATCIITGKNGFSGVKTVSFEIVKKSINHLEISEIESQVFTGQEIKPKIEIKNGNINLTEIKDYKIEYNNNIDVGQATIMLTGSGNYEGSITKTFEIIPAKISDLYISDIEDEIYTGEYIEPEISLKNGEITLNRGIDYNLSFDKNINVGKAIITINGIGNYKGTIDKTFEIKERELIILAENKEKVFGEANPELTYIIDGNINTEEPSFEGALKTNATVVSNIGEYDIELGTLQLVDNGNFKANNYKIKYIGSKLTILQKNIEDVESQLSDENYIYDGSAKTPMITINDSSKTLTNDIDYIVKYTNNIEAGTAIATVMGTGNYSGEKNIIFTINKANLNKPTIIGLYIYNGKEQIVQLDNFDNNLETVLNNKRTEYGIQDVTVQIKDTKNYQWSDETVDDIVLNWEITKRDITNLKITLEKEKYYFDGTEKRPTISVIEENIDLKEGIDYVVSYYNNIITGIATVEIAGKDNCIGNKSLMFKIDKANLSKPSIEGTYIYNGKLQIVKLNNFNDSIMNIDNNTRSECGMQKVKINLKDKQNYQWDDNTTDEVLLDWEIARRNVEDLEISLEKIVYNYDGMEKEPFVNIKDKDIILTKGIDYIVSYSNNIDAGTALVAITGIGNYTGTKTAEFTIEKAIYDMSNVKFEDLTVTYDGKVHSINVIGLPTGVKVTYQNNDKTNVGTYKVTAVFAGDATNYNIIANKTATLTINAKDISKVTTIVDTSDKTYTGKSLTTSVELKDGSTTLKENTAYTVSYKDNKDVGTATVTITGKGNYTGTITKTFKIVLGQIKVVKTKTQTDKDITIQWKKDTAVTGYEVYMSTSKNGKYSKIATIKKNSTTSYKKTGLKAGKTYYFKVRAYKTINKKDTYGSYSSILTTTTKTATPKISKVTAGNKKATIKWSKVSGATGYEVYMATSKNGKYRKKKTITNNKTFTYTQKKLTKGKTYYFKIRTYRTVDGKKVYSSYSSVKSVKIKK